MQLNTRSAFTSTEKILPPDDLVDKIAEQIENEEDLSLKEDEEEGRRRGCCLVGCLLLLLLLLLLFFALFLPVNKQGDKDSGEKNIVSTGAADWKIVSMASYTSYRGKVPSSKALIAVLKIKLTNIDTIEHQPNPAMVLIEGPSVNSSHGADDRLMIDLIYKKESTDPWAKTLKPGESRIMTLIFSIRRPGTENYHLLLKDFDWTVPDVTKKNIGQIKFAGEAP